MMETISKTEIECRFRRSVESYEENAYVQKSIVNHLVQLISRHVSSGREARLLEVGCGTGLLTTRLQELFNNKELYVNDLVEEMCQKTANRCGIPAAHCLTGDIETLRLSGLFELIVSASTFQWLEQTEQTFCKFAKHLTQGGWLIFSSFGEDNFKELKAVTGKGLHYHTVKETKELLSGYFDVIHAEENHYRLEFPNPLEILQHMKKTGVNASRSAQGWTRKNLGEFIERYATLFPDHDIYPLTYHPVYLIAQKR